jgi:hypothetical protein
MLGRMRTTHGSGDRIGRPVVRSLGIVVVHVIVVAVLVGACTAAPTPEPAESTPPLPAASPGWRSIGSLGGAGGSGWLSADFTLAGRPTAVNARCVGSGTLVVAVSARQDTPAGGPTHAFVLPCGRATPTVASIAVTDLLPVPEVATLTAGVVDDPGTVRHAAFMLSVEQPDP